MIKYPKRLPPAPASYNASKSPAAQNIVAAMSAALEDIRSKSGRPPSGKKVVSLRLDIDVIEKFKATGPGWQARINEALRKAQL